MSVWEMKAYLYADNKGNIVRIEVPGLEQEYDVDGMTRLDAKRYAENECGEYIDALEHAGLDVYVDYSAPYSRDYTYREMLRIDTEKLKHRVVDVIDIPIEL